VRPGRARARSRLLAGRLTSECFVNEISIVVVSWNARELVRQCLASIRENCRTLGAQVLLVDNASSDGTPEMVAQEFPEVHLIRNQTNLGFAKANNQALKLAKNRYVALINSDVEVLQGCLQKLIGYLEKEPSVGVLGPRMLTPGGAVGPSCMRRPALSIWLAHALGLASIFRCLSLHIPPAEAMARQEVDVLNGWFWVVRRSALAKVGLLDERFFMYGEDIEWCGRFRKRGWKVVYLPEAEAVHYGGASSSRDPIRFYVELQRARLQYWRLLHGRPSVAAYLAIACLHHAIRVIGYGLVCAVHLKTRPDALLKVKRSLASLAFLLRRTTPGPGGHPLTA
jgi:GT2 family glycosyltransferase